MKCVRMGMFALWVLIHLALVLTNPAAPRHAILELDWMVKTFQTALTRGSISKGEGFMAAVVHNIAVGRSSWSVA